MTSVTIAIPCFGQVDTLGRTLDSALAQTWPAREIIVVDDGSSPDESQQILDICEPHSDVRLVRVTNRGLPGARNTGLMLAEGDAIVFLDSDDWIDPAYIEKTLPLLTKADVVLTGIQEHGPTRNGTYMPGYDRPWQEVTAHLILNDYNRFFYCSMMRVAMLRSVGGYNTRMIHGLEDADLWVDLLNRDVRFAATNEPLFHYSTENPNSMLSTTLANRAEITAEMRRHHGDIQTPSPSPQTHQQRLGILGRMTQER